MDILKKFRYNFYYWLWNCYQVDDNGQSNTQMDFYRKADEVINKSDQMMSSNINRTSAAKINHQSAPMKQNNSKVRGDLQQWPQSKVNVVDTSATKSKSGASDPDGQRLEQNVLSPGTGSKIRDLTGTPDGFLPASITNGKKIRSDKYMVL